MSYLSYHCIEQFNTMSSNSFCKQRLHFDLFSSVNLASVSFLCVKVCQHLSLFLLLDMFLNLSDKVSINVFHFLSSYL